MLKELSWNCCKKKAQSEKVKNWLRKLWSHRVEAAPQQNSFLSSWKMS
jgi:hypothetical protein